MTAAPTAPPPIPDLGTPPWAGAALITLLAITAIPAAIIGAAMLRDRLARRRRRER